jgi:hypothetical protein
LGHILHFEEPKSLKKWIILNPQWLIDHLKTVVTSNPKTIHWVKEGWLDHSQIPKMWSDIKSDSLREFLLSVMHQFGIAIPSQDNRSFVPSRLPPQPPKSLSEMPLCRKFDFEQGEHSFLPLDIFPTIMADPQLQRLLLKDYSWQEGAVFGEEQSPQFLLKVVGSHLQLEGKGPTWILDWITRSIEEVIEKKWKGISLTVHLICGKCLKPSFTLDFIREEYEKNPEGSVQCRVGKCRANNSLQDLLNISNISLPSFKPEEFTRTKKLGRGSFGEVWMVQHRKTGISYAAKTHKPQNEKQFESLKKELSIMSSLPSHPNILGLEGYYEDQTLTIYTRCYESLTEIFPRFKNVMIKEHMWQNGANKFSKD